MSGPVFDADELFDEDYLYFYEPKLEEIGEADTEVIWRLLELEPGTEVLDLGCGHARFDPTTGRSTTERVIVRAGRTRRFTFSVRMFMAVELGDWLIDAGFTAVDFCDREGNALTAQGRRMITIARR